MVKLLLDANLSPETRKFLETRFSFDVTDIQTLNLGQIPDEEVVKLAQAQDRIIITFDLDIAEMYFFSSEKEFGAIVLRIKLQTVESVNKSLESFFENVGKDLELNSSLVIIDDVKVRITKR